MFETMEINQGSETREKTVLEQMSSMGHEQLVFCYDKETGLRSIIAIHNTVLGPALGGTRMWNYSSEYDAIIDVLRLSKGMTYKAAITGLNLGGGKAVIIGDPYKDKTEVLMRRYGKFVNSLNGKYITAEDVGMSEKDMEYIKMETDFVTGIPESMGGSGDPSPVTAYGVYMGIKASVKEIFGNDSLNEKRIIVQGVGHVGYHLVKHLSKENAKIYVFDINKNNLNKVVKDFKVEILNSEDEIYNINADIFSPCALGGILNNYTIENLKVKIIAGSANNQLEDENIHGELLKEKNILYVPDFLINAGGLINVYSELKRYTKKWAMKKAEDIYNTTLEIIKISKNKNIATYKAANILAEKRLSEISNIKKTL